MQLAKSAIIKAVPFILPAILFVMYFHLSYKAVFMQNDDFYYYDTVSNFLRGNFQLLPKVAPTFYVQGFMGLAFALLLGVKHLPVLTLAISCLNIGILYVFLKRKIKLDAVSIVFICLAVFFNPLYQYSLLGFMTENYLLTFLLLSLYFFYSYDESNNPKFLGLSTAFWFVGFFVRQVILVIPIAYSIKLFAKKKLKAALGQVLMFIFTGFIYLFVFPRSEEMHKKSLQFHHFLEPNYTYAILYGILLYAIAFFLPLFVFNMYQRVVKLSKAKLLFWIIMSIALFYVLNKFYQPMAVSWGEFPFFENTFERTGFLPRAIHGTKYFFAHNYVIYKYWEIAIKVVAAAFLASLFFSFKKIKSTAGVDTFVVLTYCALMVAAYTFYDRYLVFLLIPVIPILIGKLEKKNKYFLWLLLVPFVAFIIYFSYFISRDFVYVNSYVWQSAEKLVAQGTSPSEIYANSAWNKKFGSQFETSQYIFSYDSSKINPELRDNYKLVDQFSADFKGDLFLNPKVFLYKRL